MPEVRLGSLTLPVSPGANLLQALLDAGQRIPHSCRAGACHACLLRAQPEQVPPQANEMLTAELRQQGWLLSCQCSVEQDMDLQRSDLESSTLSARLVEREWLAPDILRLCIRPDRPLRHKPGQHLLIWLDSDLARPYSIASQPGDESLSFHLRLHPQGRFSQSIAALPLGSALALGKPLGAFGFDPEWHDRPLLLLAQGTGLAPLQAIARHALQEGHTAPITLWHWSRNGRCYLAGQLEQLMVQHPSFQLEQRASDTFDADLRQLRLASRSTMALVCGSPAFTEQLRKPLFMAGLPGRQVIAEMFMSGARPFAAEDYP